MGNNIGYEFDEAVFGGDDLRNELILQMEFRHVENSDITNAIGYLANNVVGSLPQRRTDMPVIRKRPDLRNFRNTMLYKEIKALCGCPANSKRPTDRWSLVQGLAKRENGMGYPAGSFTANQQRRIASLFVPNTKEKRILSFESKVFISKLNKDGSKLITASQDAVVRIYDSSKGTYHRINRIGARDVHCIMDIDFSPCGKYFAYSTWSNYFFVGPVIGSDEFHWIDLNTNVNRAGFFSVRFSPDGSTLIGGCNDGCIYMCDRQTNNKTKIKTRRHQSVDINSVSYVTDQSSDVFVSGCNAGIMKLWDARCLGSQRNSPVSEFIGHLDGITYIDPRNDGNHLLTNSKDQSIKIWDLRKPTPSDNIRKHSNSPYLNWDYRWDAVPRLYYNPTTTLDGDVSIMTYRGHRVTKSLLRAKFSPAEQTGQRYIYTGCATGRIIIYDVLTGTIKEAIESHKDIVRDVSWHPVRSEIISGSWDSHVNLNIFKRNPLLKRPHPDSHQGPLRRSRRIAHQRGESFDDEDVEDEHNNHW